MPAETKTIEKKQRLLSLLREMFQLDQPDLDFGLYRIMHAKRGQLEAFLETEFDQLIDKVFADRGARHEDDARKEYEAARQQAAEFGAPDPDAIPKVQQARARYDVIRLSGGENAEIYDHLHRFFSRYYDQGDFMSLRRYGKGAAGGAETYAVPYDGAEVVLHWANKDQYYIKTTENFAAFSFDPRKALHKDERGVSRSLFDDGDTGGTSLKVHFRVVEAAEGAHNNVKASDKDERYFILDTAEPLAWEGSELVVRINYRSDPAKPPKGQKQKWQATRNEQLVQTVLDALKGLNCSGNPLAGEYFEVLAREIGKGKDKTQPLLARYIGQYTATNTMDYFIHKDVGGFLRRELDFYLKNEVFKLDDFVGGEDADVQAGLSDARMKAMREALEKAQAIRILSLRLIDFLAQLEDFQKKLWLKKKFVVETHYCITLDRIPEKFYPEIAANERQREEWVRLFAIDEIKGDMATVGYSTPLTVAFLNDNPSLQVDTRFFDSTFSAILVSEIEDFEQQLNGVLIHSDNFQGLRFLTNRFQKDIQCKYIDPPYNTKSTPILYKNEYKHSSWATLILDRLKQSRSLLDDQAVSSIAIDDAEMVNLVKIVEQVWPDYRLSRVTVVHNPKGSITKDFNRVHEYALFVTPEDVQECIARTLEENETPRKMRRWGENSLRVDRRPSFYPIYVKDGKVVRVGEVPPDDFHPAGRNVTQPNGEIEVWPIDHQEVNGALTLVERRWNFGLDSIGENLNRVSIQEVDGTLDLFVTHENTVPKTVWSGGEYDAGKYGNSLLISMLGEKKFDFPKSINLVKRCIYLMTSTKLNANILDYFGGSGTTAHAVIAQNREDGGKRRYVLIEMGNHFDNVLRPRIQKAIYADNWTDARPVNRTSGQSHCMKYLRLESYEDCLNNLALNPSVEAATKSNHATMQRDYLLRYMLEVETQGSQSLLNVTEFRDPAAYRLEIKKPGSDEREQRNVDLVETFNWLIGLHVDKLHAGRRFSASFARKPDPLLPQDAHTRLQATALTEADDGAWWFRPVEGYVRTRPGDDLHRQSVLVLWRTLTDDPEQDAAALEAFLSQKMKWNPTRREDKTLYDLIYINGTHSLPNLGKYGEVRLLEEEFHRRMWAGEES
ncbi:DNA methyltransferase [Thauera phenylacetica]|uniref:DNA methyltransferase n=1 Tax=Thauera phenylacetica TaxID=164400 RepID=UPI0039E5E2B1